MRTHRYRLLTIVLLTAVGCVEPDQTTGVAASDVCQDGHDCSHLPPTCAELGCPYAPSGTSWTWSPCPQSQQLCWCWALTGTAQQCAHFSD